MQNTVRTVSDLTCLQLFRLIARSLWQTYSSGGINIGRSYQACLLEGFIDLFPCSSEEIEGDRLLEVESRFRLIYAAMNCGNCYETEQPFLPFQDLCILTDVELTLVCLQEMWRWYEEEAEAAGFFNSLHKNMSKWMLCVFRMYLRDTPLDALRSIRFDRRIIVEYLPRRFSMRKHEDRLYDFQQDINPWTDI